MSQDWQALIRLTTGAGIQIERVRIVDGESAGVVIEGRFDVPPLAELPSDDQVFVAAFVRCHGSIKQMEKFFGVSYPTIKNRLNRIGARLPFVEIEPAAPSPQPAELLGRLERGELSVADVLAELRGERKGSADGHTRGDRDE